MHSVTSFGIRSLLVRTVCALGIILFTATGTPAIAAGVTVVVDGSPLYLNPGPIERAGRVFVPLRGIFERLGASVVYENREINSTKGDISVSLRIGSREATVNGQSQIVDVAPFIVGATTYVPLRFIAQSLGAVVDYNGAMRRVAITTPRQPMPPNPAPPPMPNPPPSYFSVGARQPEPGAQFGDRFTPIGAQFSQPADAGSVRVWLDGNDITSRSNVTGRGFYYKPPAPLYFGTHNVRVAGVDRDGRRFENTWSFITRQSAPSPTDRVQLRDQRPSPGTTLNDRNTVIAANFFPPADGASVRVRLDSRDVTSRSGATWEGFSFRPSDALDFGTHTVQVTGRGRDGGQFDHSWSFTTGRPAPEAPVELRNQQPSPGATVENRFAVVAANFAPQADGASVRVRLDGNDITSRAGVSASGFSYKPPAPLDFGTHTIQVNGRARGGLAFAHSWSFTVRRGEPNPISLTIGQPNENEVVGRTFTVEGNTAPNGRVNVTAGASGSGQFNGNTTAGPKGNFHISVSLSALLGQQTVTVKITATDPASSQTAHKSLQLRLKNAAPEPTLPPKPTPAPTMRPTAPPPPTPVPTMRPTMPPPPTLPPTAAPTMRPRPMPTPPPSPPAKARASRAQPTASPTATPT